MLKEMSYRKISREAVKEKFYNPLFEQGKIKFERLLLITPEQNHDFDEIINKKDEKLFKGNRVEILKHMRSLAEQHIASLPKVQYKSTISEISGWVTQINSDVVDVVAVLGSLNETAKINLKIDTVNTEGKIILDGLNVVLDRKSIIEIQEMVRHMNHEFKNLIRSSKLSDPTKDTPKRQAPPIKNMLHADKDVLFQASNVVTEKLFDVSDEDIEYMYGLDSDSNLFKISKSLINGYYLGGTFVSILNILNHSHHIEQWFQVVAQLSDPIIFVTKEENDAEIMIVENLKHHLNKNGEVINPREFEKLLESEDPATKKAIRLGIKRNITDATLDELKIYDTSLSASKLGGLIISDVMNMIGEAGSAARMYVRDGRVLHLSAADDGRSIIRALSDKPNFDANRLGSHNFEQIMKVAGTPVKNKITDEHIEDAKMALSHSKYMAGQRDVYAKLYLVDFMKREVKEELRRRTRLGAY